MAKSVKKTVKSAPKKPVAKPAAKKITAKPVAKKPALKAKPIAKKPAPKAKPVAKKLAVKAKPVVKANSKKPVAKPIAKKSVAKKPAPKAKPITKKPVAKAKPVVKKAAPKATKKTVVKKAVPTKSVAKKSAVVKKATPKANIAPKKAKLTPKVKTTKPAKKTKLKLSIAEERSLKMAQRRKQIQEIKNNYEGPVKNSMEDDQYEEYRQPIIGRTRFSEADLKEFRDLINKKIGEAREELNFYQDQMKESEMNDDDIKFSGMEDGGHTNDKEHLSSMANRQIKFIQNLESAIIRIENKTYGICRMTGNLIDKKRLMAVPHATLSMEAKLGGKKK